MYKRQFEAAAVMNGWSDKEKVTVLLLALRIFELLQGVATNRIRRYITQLLMRCDDDMEIGNYIKLTNSTIPNKRIGKTDKSLKGQDPY